MADDTRAATYALYRLVTDYSGTWRASYADDTTRAALLALGSDAADRAVIASLLRAERTSEEDTGARRLARALHVALWGYAPNEAPASVAPIREGAGLMVPPSRVDTGVRYPSLTALPADWARDAHISPHAPVSARHATVKPSATPRAPRRTTPDAPRMVATANQYQTEAMQTVRAILHASAHGGATAYQQAAATYALDAHIPLSETEAGELDALVSALAGTQDYAGARLTELPDATRRAFYAFLHEHAYQWPTVLEYQQWVLSLAKQDAYGRYAAERGTEGAADRATGAGRFTRPGATWASYLLVSIARMCMQCRAVYDDMPDVRALPLAYALREREAQERKQRRDALREWRALEASMYASLPREQHRGARQYNRKRAQAEVGTPSHRYRNRR